MIILLVRNSILLHASLLNPLTVPILTAVFSSILITLDLQILYNRNIKAS